MKCGIDSVVNDIDKIAAQVNPVEWGNTEHLAIPLMVISAFALILIACFRWRTHKVSFSDFVSRNLTRIAMIVCLCGMAIYFVGYSDLGTGRNVITLLIRSALSSFEMFLSKSNLIGVSEGCKESPFYMFCFALIHASAMAVSMIFVISCFGKRLRDWFVLQNWRWSLRLFNKQKELYVFWGVNEKSILLANDIQQAKCNVRMVFVDFPCENEENKSGQSFSGLLGLLRYNVPVAKQLSGIDYVMIKTDISLSGQEIASVAQMDSNSDAVQFLENLHLYKLSKLVKLHENVSFFILGDDEESNLRSSLRLLGGGNENIKKVYCCARRSRASLIHEEVEPRLRIVDDSHEAVMKLAMKQEKVSQPINFVSVDAAIGGVTSQFSALIIGYGNTGRDALKFLYEFSAFPDSNGEKSPVKFYVCDKRISDIKGEIYQEIPAMKQIEKSGEVEFCPYNYGSEEFLKKLNSIIQELNYVVVATGSDALNLHIATQLYEFAMQYKSVDSRFERFKIFVRLYDSSSKYLMEQTIKRYGESYADALMVFGEPKEIYCKSWLIDDAEVCVAAKFIESYVAASEKFVNTDEAGSSKPRIKDSYSEIRLLKCRNALRGDSQNRANFRHRYTKSVLLGLDKMESKPELPKWEFSAEISDWYKKLLNVSICEHLRWNASHQMLGYTPWPLEEADKYSDSCDWLTKRHKYIVPWNRLDSNVKNYDYVVVVTTVDMCFEKSDTGS